MLAETFSDVTVYGLHAEEPIASIVKARGDRARRLARIDRFGLRYRLPESFDARLRVVLRRTAQQGFDPDEFTLDRLWHDREADRGLDLLGDVRP